MTRRDLIMPSAIGALALTFVCLHLLRMLEHPELDQSLFTYYGQWMFQGLSLYSDLWDSKPPGIFALYGGAARIVGARGADGFLHMLVAAACSGLTYKLVRTHRCASASLSSAAFAGFLWSAPPFGGALSTAQAEALMAPLLLATALAARGRVARGGFMAGCLLGAAFCLKIVALFLLPLAWIFTPKDARWSPRHLLWVGLGLLVVPAACATGLALTGALDDGARAVLLYPRAYAAEIMSRIELLPALATAATRLVRGLPLTLVFACTALLTHAHDGLVRRSFAWLALAAVAAASQRAMSGYHLLLLVPPLALLAGIGMQRAWQIAAAAWRGTQRLDAKSAVLLVMWMALLGVAGAVELRVWARQYAPHVARARGRLADDAFLERQGAAGRLWLEAQEIGLRIRETATDADRLLVWGLAPAVYLHAECPPATRYAFHQTFLVDGSALSRRWPDAAARRSELLRDMQARPARFVVVVRGDRNGFEPRESAAELQEFPALRRTLERDYTTRYETTAYTLLVRKGSLDE